MNDAKNKAKICFEVDEQLRVGSKTFPRGYNLSEKLRVFLKILIEKDGGQ